MGQSKYRYVVLDADDTAWRINPDSIASMCSVIGRTADPNVIELYCPRWRIDADGWVDDNKDGPNAVAILMPKLREAIDLLRKADIGVGLASFSSTSSLKNFTDAFNLKFDHIEGQPEGRPNPRDWRSKREMVSDIARKTSISPEDILFVDDDPDNVRSVSDFGSVGMIAKENITGDDLLRAVGL